MGIVLLFSGLIPTGILVGIGVLIKYKKAYWLISGYNTMSAEKKKNVDIEGLGRFTANVCFVIAAIILVASILMLFGKMAISGIVFALMLPITIYILIKAQKFDGNTCNSEGKMKTGTKVIISTIIAVIVLSAVGVGVLIYFSNKPAEYTLQNGILKISGMYGQEVFIYEISGLELIETIPKILFKTNGAATETMLKGYFKLKDIGEAKIFVDVSKPPFIYLKSNSKILIINCDDGEKTEELYERLNTEWQKSVKQ